MPKRTGRVLVGLSAGGYGAFNIGLRNPRVFAAVESWSGYSVATDPSGRHVLKLLAPRAQQGAPVPNGKWLAAKLRRWPVLIAFYVGTADNRFADMNQGFEPALRINDIQHVFRT